MRSLYCLICLLLLNGCASYGVIENQPKASISAQPLIMKPSSDTRHTPPALTVMLAFSGGGHRAAALSYGVLDTLRGISLDSERANGQDRLLDYVNSISAVSGGTFTAAYYGLVGEKIFDQYEDDFLVWNMQDELLDRITSFRQLFGDKGRSEVMIKLLDRKLFQGATLADINRPGSPSIILNASDLGRGVRLSFLPNYFDLLCSDINSFPVARAVTASAAVPIAFSPIVLENHDHCGSGSPKWLHQARQRLADNQEMSLVVEGLSSYGDKNKRRYIHLVDGGITDNLGLRAVYENVQLSGGIQAVVKSVEHGIPKHLVVIAVDAATQVEVAMDQSLEEPSLSESVNGITDAQLHRYNAATLDLFEHEVKQWARELSTEQQPVDAYFIKLSLQDIPSPEKRQYFNQIPTSLSLSREQLNALTQAAETLLLSHPEFIRLQQQLPMRQGPDR